MGQPIDFKSQVILKEDVKQSELAMQKEKEAQERRDLERKLIEDKEKEKMTNLEKR